MAIITLGANAITALPVGIGGKVLQVVEFRQTTVRSTTGTSWEAIVGMDSAITPTSASNKILICANFTLSSTNHGHVRFSRDNGSNYIGNGVSVASRSGVNFYANCDVNTARPQSMMFLDSPNTTSLITYKAFWRVSSSVTYLNRTPNDTDAAFGSRGVSSVTLMEIAG